MKVFFIIRGLHDIGGIERVTTIVANELAERGYDIGVVCLQKGTPYFELHKDITLHHTNSKIFRKKELKALYAKENPDINIFLGSHRSLMNIPASKGIPCITWEHFNAHINWHPWHKYSRKLAVQHCDKIVTLTRADVENYQQFFNAKNVLCIPNPITIDNITPTSLNNKTLLAVGRLAGQKGFDMLIDAWGKAQAKDSGWKLRIVGSGSHKARLLKQINENNVGNSVNIVPPTKNIIKEYHNASALAMSSRFEGLPLVLIEAMSAGLPIVSFDCQTGPAEIIHHNKTGLLVPPENTDLLAKAIDELLLDEEKIKQFSKQSLIESQRFSIDNIVDLWEELLHKVKSSS